MFKDSVTKNSPVVIKQNMDFSYEKGTVWERSLFNSRVQKLHKLCIASTWHTTAITAGDEGGANGDRMSTPKV
jgi:hypothetical protein